jgi:hypothetical protein
MDTEDIAIRVDVLAPGRFRWRKYKQHIDLGLVRNGLQDARKKQLVSGGAVKGWMLTHEGVKEATKLLPELADHQTQVRISSEQRIWETRERARLQAEPSFQLALENGAASLQPREILRLFRIDEYVSPDRRAERLRRFTSAFQDDAPMKRVIHELVRSLSNE